MSRMNHHNHNTPCQSCNPSQNPPSADIPQTLPSFPENEMEYPENISPDIPQGTIPPILGTKPTPPPMQRCARIRFFHAAPQADPVNVNVGIQRAATNLAFGNFSSYQCFSEGFHTVTITNARSGRMLLLQTTAPLVLGETITFAIVSNPTSGSLELVEIKDNFCSGQLGGFACIRMVNLLLGSDALDMLHRNGKVLFSDVRYKEATMPRRLRAKQHLFYVAKTPSRIEPRFEEVELDENEQTISERYLPGYGEVDLMASFSLRAKRGVMYTAYVIGQENIDDVQVIISAL